MPFFEVLKTTFSGKLRLLRPRAWVVHLIARTSCFEDFLQTIDRCIRHFEPSFDARFVEQRLDLWPDTFNDFEVILFDAFRKFGLPGFGFFGLNNGSGKVRHAVQSSDAVASVPRGRGES